MELDISYEYFKENFNNVNIDILLIKKHYFSKYIVFIIDDKNLISE